TAGKGGGERNTPAISACSVIEGATTQKPMSLVEYKRKRKFSKTPEPKAKVKPRKAKGLSFVIQKHDATRLHYDFRLEMDGVLKSWAVPKGIPTKRADKRLAM